MSVFQIYVEKKPEFANEAAAVAEDLKTGLQLDNIDKVRLINRYFAEKITNEDFDSVKRAIFSEPPVDIIYNTLPDFERAESARACVFAVEYLPGQFDQRADSCAQCISLATGKERPLIQSAKVYAIYGDITDADFTRIKAYLINPVESREAGLEKPQTLIQNYPSPSDVEILDGFNNLNNDELDSLRANLNLAMDLDDIKFCQGYFRDEEKRDPSITEIRVLDTYWSDHCRHTTFLTELNLTTEDTEEHGGIIRESYQRYLEMRNSLGRSDKPITLMDIATIGAKALKRRGLLPDIDESEEINACSVKIKVDVNGKDEDWLLMFKNETHNHPTEIEPFGGSATCLGGAIRDPLSGRAFVYQAMRVTGAANPLEASTLPGKLPQRKICRTAANGYSSYGNQIGLATGLVQEIYHPGYAAKRMEVGAVIGAAPAANVRRETPTQGDVVLLVGGRTGRDGIGGATGSSKAHTASSLETCGADVQKGNAPEERKLQRLFRDPSAAQLIKRCNDFGAGGVCVSVGELADGLCIDLDKVPKKYEGLDGTELAISESQERMSVVVDKQDAQKFIDLAGAENLEATVIAEVTEEARLVMNWRGKVIVNLSREFLNSNGAKKYAKVLAGGRGQGAGGSSSSEGNNLIDQDQIKNNKPAPCSLLPAPYNDLNICSQKGLVDRFDSSIGAATVTAPFGGKYQMTPAQSMAAKIPVLSGETNTVSIMSYGFDPFLSEASPYHGAVYAVVHSLAKIIAAGGSRKKCWLSFQEYFERLRDDPIRWGKPFSALLGALDAQMGLEIAAIGGKDSMSGSFENIDVPPTLISFAVSVTKAENVVTPEFKKAGSFVYLLMQRRSGAAESIKDLKIFFDEVENLLIRNNPCNSRAKILSCWAVGTGGTAEAIPKMCFGNRIGFKSEVELTSCDGFGGFIVETEEPIHNEQFTMHNEFLGKTTESYILKTPSSERFMFKIQSEWEKVLEPVYPTRGQGPGVRGQGLRSKVKLDIPIINNKQKSSPVPCSLFPVPLFIIPVFPGTNSEYDTARAIQKAGGKAELFVIRNLTPVDIAESVKGFARLLKNAQGLVIPGGFSGGDEPDGSGKFITAFMRNSQISDAVAQLLQKRDGLVCGICNGFQALIKLGLVPYGEIRDMNEDSPTLTFNTIGRHQSLLVRAKIVSNKSPWLSHLKIGDTYSVPISHGEGRFIASEELIRGFAENGQIATQYVDMDGNPTQDIRYNPNNSMYAIEGITSLDGRVFGRMAHNERVDDGCYVNIPGIRKMDIFKGAVEYFAR